MIYQMDTSINDGVGQRSVFANEIIAFVKTKCRLNIVEWEPMKADYPSYILLGPDKGILAYINFDVVSLENKLYLRHKYEKLLVQLRLAVSDLDRPVFNIYQLQEADEKNIYFETYEQIIDILFHDVSRIKKDDKGEKYFYSDIKEMGCINELFNIFLDLKKHNVRFY